jgi:signal transduction histidine kinase
LSLLSSLSNRIFLASALLAVVSIAAAVSLVNFVATRRAETELERSLNEAGQLVTQFQSLLFQHLVREARLIADLPRLKAAVYEQHAPTAEPVAAEYQAMLEADLVVITNRRGEALAVVGDPGGPAAQIRSREGIREALAGADHVALWSGRDELLQVVTVPIVLESEVLGTLSAGVSLSRRLADRIKQLTRSEVVFFDRGRMQASTLPPDANASLRSAAGAEGTTHLTIGSQEYVAIRRPLSIDLLSTGSRESPSSPGTFALVLLSRTEHLAFLSTLHSGLALTAVLAVLLATLLSYAVSRTITRPVRALTASMREIAATGNLSAHTASRTATRWEDEDARVLTGAFDSLTQSLGRFQREAAQRERLSSLGRLSTVLAHEVRNPLMIIKASLRTLRRGAGDPGHSVQAVDDIEGEVNRLNRLVHEVLDYARPIAFSFSEVDLASLVRDAAHAASVSQDAPAIAVEASDGFVVRTDVERLRQALVNVLANARDAVLARQRAGGSDDPSLPPITIRVSSPAAGTVLIAVQDRGPGMSAEHMARIFEPFFTTKQTGSGIGLAITRNIVEGLGGRVDVESRIGEGTTVRFVLPR